MRRRISRLLIGAILVGVVTFAVGEIFVRLAVGAPGHLLYTGSFRDVQTDWDIVYDVDANGVRVTCAPEPKLPEARRFAVIGDSFAFGQGVEDCADFVSRLNAISPSWAFENLGLIGGGLPEYILVARDLIRPDHAGVLLLVFGNDVGLIDSARGTLGKLADRFSIVSLVRKAKRAWIVARAARARDERGASTAAPATATTQRGDTDGSRDSTGPISFYGDRPNNTLSALNEDPDALRKGVEPEPGRVEYFRAKFDELAALLAARIDPASVYVAMVPSGHVVSKRMHHFVIEHGGSVAPFGEPGSAYALVRELAEAHGFHFIDTFPAFLRNGDALYHPHDMHWSPQGHARMAEIVREELDLDGDGG